MSLPRVFHTQSDFITLFLFPNPPLSLESPFPNLIPSQLCFSPFSPHFSAIYNYEAAQDVELSLQVGDTVHILEMYEGRCSSQRGLRGKQEQIKIIFHILDPYFQRLILPKAQIWCVTVAAAPSFLKQC